MSKLITAIKMAFYALFAYLEINVESFFILMIFMCADSILGAMSSIRVGDKFKFSIFYWGFISKLCILIIPLLVALLAKNVGQDFSMAIVITIKLLTVSEFYSSVGHTITIKKKKRIEKVDINTLILQGIREVMVRQAKSLIKKLTSNESNPNNR